MCVRACVRVCVCVRARVCVRTCTRVCVCVCVRINSLRVNLDLSKVFHSWSIGRDKQIPETVVRSSTIPEELGRIVYLLSDKTGTLTQNEMVSDRVECKTLLHGCVLSSY